jgi:thymidylate synthase (FAD)
MANIIQPSYEILFINENPLQLIEKAARTCYKSEDKITDDSAEKLVRSLINNGHHAMIEFGFAIVKFISNRGFTHEVVRHRLSSFAQESTLYVNYNTGKFNNECQFIDPTWMVNLKIQDEELRKKIIERMLMAWVDAEEHYMKLTSMGCPAEIAREVLPIGLKAEIVIMANFREWRHIFNLRTSKKAHPRMRELMIPLQKEFQSRIPVLFA